MVYYSMETYYEWIVEQIDKHGDVEETNAYDTYAQAAQSASRVDSFRVDIGICRTNDNGRTWAYIKDGILPEHFEDAYQNRQTKVPKRFHQEVS